MTAKKTAATEKYAEIPIKTLQQFYEDMKAGELFGFYNIPEEVYRPAPGHNWSKISHIQKSFNSYDFYNNNELEPDEKEKAFFTLGHLFHCLVLEPDTLDARYTTFPETYPAKWNTQAALCKKWKNDMDAVGFVCVRPSNTKYDEAMTFGTADFESEYAMAQDEGKPESDSDDKLYVKTPDTYDAKWIMSAGFCKDWVADMKAKGITSVSRKMMRQAKGMAAVLTRIPAVQKKLANVACFEVAAFWKDAVHGCLCKCKLDALRQTSEIIDLKSYRIYSETEDPNEAALKTMYWEQYYVQAAFYRDGVDTILRIMRLLPKNEALLFTFFYTDKTPEKDTVILHIDARKDEQCLSTDWYRCGQIVYRDCLKKVLEGEASGKWPSHNPGADGFTEPMEAYVPEFLTKYLETSTM